MHAGLYVCVCVCSVCVIFAVVFNSNLRIATPAAAPSLSLSLSRINCLTYTCHYWPLMGRQEKGGREEKERRGSHQVFSFPLAVALTLQRRRPCRQSRNKRIKERDNEKKCNVCVSGYVLRTCVHMCLMFEEGRRNCVNVSKKCPRCLLTANVGDSMNFLSLCRLFAFKASLSSFSASTQPLFWVFRLSFFSSFVVSFVRSHRWYAHTRLSDLRSRAPCRASLLPLLATSHHPLLRPLG